MNIHELALQLFELQGKPGEACTIGNGIDAIEAALNGEIVDTNIAQEFVEIDQPCAAFIFLTNVAVEDIDAALFTGDEFLSDERRTVFRLFLYRWLRRLHEIDGEVADNSTPDGSWVNEPPAMPWECEAAPAQHASESDDPDAELSSEAERAAFNSMMRWHLIRMLQAWRYGGDLKAIGMSAFEWARSNDVGQKAFKASEHAVTLASSEAAPVTVVDSLSDADLLEIHAGWQDSEDGTLALLRAVRDQALASKEKSA